MEVSRFDIFLVNLDPTIGREIKKTTPCLIISPNEMNAAIATVVIAPMTTKGRSYPTRIACEFKRKHGEIVLDQIRTIDKRRLIKQVGVLDSSTQKKTCAILQQMFEY